MQIRRGGKVEVEHGEESGSGARERKLVVVV